MPNAGRVRRRAANVGLAAFPWILIGSVVAGALNYGYALSMTALLRPASYSVFASGQAVLLITGTIANGAVPWLLAREIASADGRPPGGTVWFALVLNVVEGLVAAVVVAGIALSFAGIGVDLWIGFATFGFFIASTGMGWAQGHERFGLLAVLIIGEVAIKVAAGVAFVGIGLGPSGAFAAALLGAIAIFVGMLRPMWRDLRPAWRGLRRSRLWASGVGMGFVQAGVTALSVIDVLYVSIRFGSGGSGASYQVAATVARTPLFIALAFATEAFPGLARSPGDPRLLTAHAERILGVLAPLLVLVVTVPSSVFSSVLPAGYATAAHYLPIAATTSTAYALVILETTVLRAAGRIRGCLVILGAGLVTSVICMIFGSSFDVLGMAVGAAVGGCLTLAALAAYAETLWAGAQRPDLKPLLIWACVGGAMLIASTSPFVWIGAAAIVSIVMVRAALSKVSAVHQSPVSS